MLMRAREGDFVESVDRLIFDVKGLVHPKNKVIAFLRYFPEKKGLRERGKSTYSKVYSLSKRSRFLSEKFPNYIIYDPVLDEELCEIPVDSVKYHYKPTEKLLELRNSDSLDEIESLALQLAKLLKETAKIPWDAIGVSGSIMVGLHTPSSDIDPIVYGSENCRKVHSALRSLLNEKNSAFEPYTLKDLKVLFDFRSKDTVMSYEDFVRSESRKVVQGKFLQRDYFIRCVKDWSEVDEKYGDIRYVNVGYAKVEATVADDSESIFTPCVYRVSDVRVLEGTQIESVEEIASFRGRFCEQARTGEVVIAQGKVERVRDNRQDREYYRLLIGNRPSDYMILA